MASRSFSLLLLSFSLVACLGERQAAPPAESPPAAGVGSGSAPGSAAPEAAPPAAAPAPMAPSAPAAAVVLASQETNWSGVVAEVTEFLRKGNTLTAKVRLRNTAGADVRSEIKFDEVYLMDAGNARKYEALRDEQGRYIASLRSGWNDRWYDDLAPGQQHLLWMKFPAPPPEVTAITLQLPGMPPFEDLAIQDG